MKKEILASVFISLIVGVIFVVFVSLFPKLKKPQKISTSGTTTQETTTLSNLVLFFGIGSPWSAKVEEFIVEKKVEEKVKIEKREVFLDPQNKELLRKIANFCNLEEPTIPLLWDPQQKKCILGYEEIIKYLEENFLKVEKK
jgi:hypothetical protein